MEIDGQVIVLILFVVISGIQWLIKKVQGKGDEHDISDSIEEIYDDFREEIRQRQTTIQQPAPPPLPVNLPPQAPIQEPHYEAPREVVLSPVSVRKPELTAAQKEAAERFEQLGRKKRRQSQTSAHSSARALLASPQSARQAVILHEIFGKPRSMQES